MSALLLVATMAVAGWGRAAGECNKPPALENGMLENEFISMSTFESGIRVRYRCVPGFVLASGSSPFISCKGDVWEQLQTRCQIKSCGSPGDILNGESTSTGNTFGSTVTFSCNSGYLMVGRDIRRCEVNGWSGQVPKCEAIKCPDLPAIENGKSPSPSGADFWDYGMVAEYSCNDGYSLIGLRTITCEGTGQWSGAPPSCKDVTCPHPKIPAHGRMIGGFADVFVYGHEITFRCDEGYVMKGARVIKCGENNTFAPSPPTCQPADKCPDLPAIENGKSPSPSGADFWDYGMVAEYSCNDGYSLIGLRTITCEGTGQWSGAPPSCKDTRMSVGQKVGITVGVIIACIAFIAVIVVIFRICKCCKGKQRNSNCEPDSGQAGSNQMKPLTS